MTKLDKIADTVAEIDIDEKSAHRILDAMREFKSEAQRTYRSLMQIPGFAKLWNAIKEAATCSAPGRCQ